jgi:hypothetical protein
MKLAGVPSLHSWLSLSAHYSTPIGMETCGCSYQIRGLIVVPSTRCTRCERSQNSTVLLRCFLSSEAHAAVNPLTGSSLMYFRFVPRPGFGAAAVHGVFFPCFAVRLLGRGSSLAGGSFHHIIPFQCRTMCCIPPDMISSTIGSLIRVRSYQGSLKGRIEVAASSIHPELERLVENRTWARA